MYFRIVFVPPRAARIRFCIAYRMRFAERAKFLNNTNCYPANFSELFGTISKTAFHCGRFGGAAAKVTLARVGWAHYNCCCGQRVADARDEIRVPGKKSETEYRLEPKRIPDAVHDAT